MISGFSTLNKKSQYRSGKRTVYYGLLLRRALDSTVVEDCEEVYRRIGIFSMEPDSSQDEIKIDRWGQEMLLPVERTWGGWEGKDLKVI